MLLNLCFLFVQIFCASSIITESFYIIPGPDQYFYAPKRFIENHCELVYRRISYFAECLNKNVQSMDDTSSVNTSKTKCIILYKNEPLKTFYDLFLNIFDDHLTGDFYNCYVNEIKHYISNFLNNQGDNVSKDKSLSDYSTKDTRDLLLGFHNKELAGFYNDILEKHELNEEKLTKMITGLSQSLVANTEVVFCVSMRSNFEVIVPETIQKAYMGFMLPFKNPKNGLRLQKAVMTSIMSILNSETKQVFLLFDCHAEQFIFEYLSNKILEKIEPDLQDCNKFLIEIYDDIKMILNTTNRDNKSGKNEGSRVNLCFVRSDEELALKHLNFAMCHFVKKDENTIKEIYKNLNLIEEILPSYLFFILTGFRNDEIFFEIDIYIPAYQKFDENIQNEKTIRYEDNEYSGCEDYLLLVDFYGLFDASTADFSNPIPRFKNMSVKILNPETENSTSTDPNETKNE